MDLHDLHVHLSVDTAFGKLMRPRTSYQSRFATSTPSCLSKPCKLNKNIQN